MANRKVLPVPVENNQLSIDVPAGAHIRAFGYEKNSLKVFAEVDQDQDNETVPIRILRSNDPVPDDYVYIGSAVSEFQGQETFHLYVAA